MRRLSASAGARLLFVLFCVSLSAGGQEQNRLIPHRYVIPEGYVGWVKVDFNVKDAPPLSVKDGYYVLNIPPTGHLATSSDDEYQTVKDVYYQLCDDVQQRLSLGSDNSMVWGHFKGPAGTFNSKDRPYKYRYFFVGSKEQYHQYRFSKDNPSLKLDEDGYPKAGPVDFIRCKEHSNNSSALNKALSAFLPALIIPSRY
jgi:hypothetical protein